VLILKSATMFSYVADEALVDIAALLKPVDAPAGTTIIREQEMGSTLYIIVDGRVRVHRGGRTIAELGEREVFGGIVGPRPGTALSLRRGGGGHAAVRTPWRRPRRPDDREPRAGPRHRPLSVSPDPRNHGRTLKEDTYAHAFFLP
jgi:CRP-like cAMP-binding protein